MYPYQRLLEEGYQVDIAAPSRKQLQFVVHDFAPGFDTYTEKLGRTWPADLAFAEVDPEQYAALVIPGGRAPEYLRGNKECRQLAQHFADAGKPIAALCHGPLILAAIGALHGRTSSAYPQLEPDLAAAGAQWVDSPAHVEGTIVTGRAWPDHPQWMRAFLEVLRAEIR
jgi:protease I